MSDARGLAEALRGAQVVLLRHGETDCTRTPYRFQGRLDEPLNGRGRQQARALAESASGLGFEAVWSSDLSRALETARAIAAPLGLEVRVDRRLSESHRGEWEGRLVQEVAGEYPELYAAWRDPTPDFRFPGGESLAEHRLRAAEALQEVLAGPLPALVVSHGGTIRCLLEPDLTRFHRLRVPNCACFGLDAGGRPVDPVTAAPAPP